MVPEPGAFEGPSSGVEQPGVVGVKDQIPGRDALAQGTRQSGADHHVEGLGVQKALDARL